MGYRYAYERRAYLALSPKQRLQVKEIMEQIWQDKGGVDALRKYRTYTNPGDIVLDNCAGSGTTAIAAIRSGRQFICIEQNEEYYAAACERVRLEEEASNGTA